MAVSPNKKVVVAGLGAVGLPVAEWLSEGVDGFDLVGVSGSTKERAADKVKDFKNPPPVYDLDELVGLADIIVEALRRLRNFLILPFLLLNREKFWWP